MKHKATFSWSLIFVQLIALVGCGGGGGPKGTSAASSAAAHPVTTLAQITGVGNITISESRAYFSQLNSGTIFSVSTDGGELATHFQRHASFDNVVHIANAIYVTDGDNGAIISIPDTSEDNATLSRNQDNASLAEDVATDSTNVYWSEFGSGQTSKVFRIPISQNGSAPLYVPMGASTDSLISFPLAGIAKIALDGTKLFVSEGGTGNIYKVDLASGGVSTLVTQLSLTPSSYTNSAGYPLVAAGGYLYALIDSAKIVQIDEVSGVQKTVVNGMGIYYNRIKSDGETLYWLEILPAGVGARSYSSRSQKISDITPVSSISGDYCVAGNQIWWLAESLDRTTVSSVKVSAQGGTPMATSTFNKAEFAPPIAMACDLTSLYWLNNDGIIAMSKADGIPAFVSKQGITFTAIALTDSYIVWTDWVGAGIRKIHKTARSVVPTTIWQATSPSSPGTPVSDTSKLYWGTGYYNHALYSWTVATGQVSNLGPIRADIVFPYGDLLYFTGVDHIIYAVPNSGSGSPVQVVSVSGAASIVDIYVANDIVYFTTSDNWLDGGVYGYDQVSRTLTTYTSSRPQVDHLFVDGNYIYWTERTKNGGFPQGGVFRIALARGDVEPIYTDSECWGITGDTTKLYWSSGFGVLSTSK
jgi:hypothetical protein